MTTAIIFAGADALDNLANRSTVLDLKSIRIRLEMASQIWSSFSGEKESLVDFLSSPDEIFHSKFTKKAICSTSIQIGLYDQLIKSGIKPDFLIGCSLGDTARTVCAQVASFEEAIHGIALFGQRGEKIQNGAILQLRFENHPTDLELNEIEAKGLKFAVFQTPKHILVSGPENIIQAYSNECQVNGKIRTRYLYNKPLHSPWMEPAASVISAKFSSELHLEGRVQMISTTLGKLIKTPQDLTNDFLQNMTGTVYWYQTIQMAIHKYQIKKLINIGPNKTLLSFLARTPLPASINFIDYPIESAA